MDFLCMLIQDYKKILFSLDLRPFDVIMPLYVFYLQDGCKFTVSKVSGKHYSYEQIWFVKLKFIDFIITYVSLFSVGYIGKTS